MSTTKISNSDIETFILPIDISKYGALEFNPDELEIRVTNDYIEVCCPFLLLKSRVEISS